MTFVLFGATGDLAQRKIMPALLALFARDALGDGTRIVAFSRRPWSNAEYREFIQPSLKSLASEVVEQFLQKVSYVQGTFDNTAGFLALKEKIGGDAALYHLAVQPEFYTEIVEQLGKAGLTGALMIEKPFGHDYASAQMLERTIEKYFPPEHLYRVDHYLGKEGLDALLLQRMRDTDFEKSLTQARVARVTARILESLGIEGRGEFYDATGALMDVGQSHALEMLATMLMELPPEHSQIPAARAVALEALGVDDAAPALRGQYKGYMGEEGVSMDSDAETYFMIGAVSSVPRWQGVPLLLEAGKALREKRSEIEISYKDGTSRVFDMEVPRTRDAYEVLIEAALAGDRSRFPGMREVLASWVFAEAAARRLNETPLLLYGTGGDGPAT